MTRPLPLLGAAAIGLAILYNAAFARLATIFDYPDILRRSPGEVLALFDAGGGALILTWYAFALSAVAFVVIGPALALARRAPTALPLAAALFAALAGAMQAVGLLRWVFAVPELSTLPRTQAAAAFLILNQWGGVAIGEHLGQWLTALFLGTMALVARAEGRVLSAGLAAIAAVLIVVGAQEGVLLALDRDPGLVPLIAVAGYLGLSAWLVMEGIRFLGFSGCRVVAA